ncbi:three-Cys-motif partner protein TcmP [Rhizobium leguminosarum]
MTNVYQDREQTEAKHFILRKYLQTLAFKTLHGGWSTLAYIDGFSGPWQSKTPDHSDSSFMIAIEVLKDAQSKVRAAGKKPRVKCLFVEEKAGSFAQLHPAVSAHHDPANDFFVETFRGKFENALPQIQRTMSNAFALTFIDPTGWTGYEFNKVNPVFEHAPGEVLLNFMFDFVNRFTSSSDPKTLASFAGILGPDWQQRLDPLLPREEALMALFTEQFWKAGKFSYVLSTPIEKISDRTHFHIVYGTRSPKGLEAYRQVEYDALKDHGMRRATAREMMRAKKTGQIDLFGAEGAASVAEGSMEAQIASIKHQAKDWLRQQLPTCPQPFSNIWPMMLDKFMLRKTDARDICAELGKSGEIKETWRMNGSRRQKPDDNDQIERP